MESPPSPPPLPPIKTGHHRTPSIEEPKTLTLQELNSLREAALHVIDTHTPEEATRIFMEGFLPPVDVVNPKTLPKEKVREIGHIVKDGSWSA